MLYVTVITSVQMLTRFKRFVLNSEGKIKKIVANRICEGRFRKLRKFGFWSILADEGLLCCRKLWLGDAR